MSVESPMRKSLTPPLWRGINISPSNSTIKQQFQMTAAAGKMEIAFMSENLSMNFYTGPKQSF